MTPTVGQQSDRDDGSANLRRAVQCLLLAAAFVLAGILSGPELFETLRDALEHQVAVDHVDGVRLIALGLLSPAAGVVLVGSCLTHLVTAYRARQRITSLDRALT